MMQREGRWPDFTKHVPGDLAIPFLGISLTEIHARRFTYQDLAAVGSETNVRLPGCSEVTEKNGEPWCVGELFSRTNMERGPGCTIKWKSKLQKICIAGRP